MFKNSVGSPVHVYPFFLLCKFCENSEEPLCGNEMKRNAKQKWREFPWGEILEYRLGLPVLVLLPPSLALKLSLSQVAAAIW